MPRPLLAVLLLAAVSLSAVPATASAACNGATRVRAADVCPPDAVITASSTRIAPGETVELSAAQSGSTPAGTLTTYEWDLDGDEAYETPGITASRTFSDVGTFTVRLRVTDQAGLVGTRSVAIAVSHAPTAVLVASDPNPLSKTQITLDASGSHDYETSPGVPEGPIDGFRFDLDGDDVYELGTGATPTATVTFATPGTKTVGVEVTDHQGSTAVKRITVVVRNRAPVAQLALPGQVVTGRRATLSAAGSTDADGTVASYRWDLDGQDGFEVDGGTSPTITRTWPSHGAFPIGVEVTDDAGDKAVATATVTVKAAPVAALTATPADPVVGALITLDASGSTDADGGVTSHTWDLDGDGVFETPTGAGATAEVMLGFAATVVLRVRVADADGLVATAAVSITVKAAARRRRR